MPADLPPSPSLRSLTSPWDRVDTPQTPLVPLGALSSYAEVWSNISVIPDDDEPVTTTSVGRYIVAPPPANYMGLVLVGTGDADDFFDAKVWGWRPADDGIIVWNPSLLVELDGCTLGTQTGVSGATIVTSSVKYVDGITTPTDHSYKNSLDIVGRVAANRIPMVVFDISGFALIEVRTTTNGTGSDRASTHGGLYTFF